MRSKDSSNKSTAKNMDQPLFETKFAAYRILVYSNRIVFKKVMGQEEVIMTKQITSVNTGLFFQAHIVIETSDGKKHKLPVMPKEKEKLRDAINEAMAS